MKWYPNYVKINVSKEVDVREMQKRSDELFLILFNKKIPPFLFSIKYLRSKPIYTAFLFKSIIKHNVMLLQTEEENRK
jgi:hypothetical protein